MQVYSPLPSPSGPLPSRKWASEHQQHGKILIFDGNFSSLFVTYFALFCAFCILFWLQLISFNDIASISWYFSLFSTFSDEKLEKSAR